MAIELQKNDRFMCFPLLQYICSLKYGRVTANCDAAMHLEDKHYQQFKKCISRRHHRTLCDDGAAVPGADAGGTGHRGKRPALGEADWLIEMGPEAGANGRRVVAPGTILDIAQNKNLQIGPFLAGTADVHVRDRAKPVELFDLGTIHLSTGAIHTVKPLDVDIPKGRLTAVTGVSDSGKITLILESLVLGPPPQGLVSPR